MTDFGSSDSGHEVVTESFLGRWKKEVEEIKVPIRKLCAIVK
jgi:hypothetical protein